MTNPQLEDGFTRISNEIMEALPMTRISGQELGFLLIILRRTYGWRRKEAVISLTEFAKAGCCDSCRAAKVLNALEGYKMINRVKSLSGNTYSFNKHYCQWIGNGKVSGIVTTVQTDSVEMDTVEIDTVRLDTVEMDTENSVEMDTVSCPSTPDSMPAAEGLKKYKEILNTNTCVSTKTTSKRNEYSEEFESFWKVYPRAIGKSTAYKAWNARRKEGGKPEDMIKAAENYRASCIAKGTEERYIKHPSTFLNPDWAEYLGKAEQQTMAKSASQMRDELEREYGR
jgi:phage replication O-like protein O